MQLLYFLLEYQKDFTGKNCTWHCDFRGCRKLNYTCTCLELNQTPSLLHCSNFCQRWHNEFYDTLMTSDVVQFSTELKSDYISVSLKQILDLAMQSLLHCKLLSKIIQAEKIPMPRRERFSTEWKISIIIGVVWVLCFTLSEQIMQSLHKDVKKYSNLKTDQSDLLTCIFKILFEVELNFFF